MTQKTCILDFGLDVASVEVIPDRDVVIQDGKIDLGGFASWLDLAAQTREVRLDNVRRMHEVGVTILAGSDEPDSGIIEAGKRADLLLVNGDPTRDINALADIREVFLQGVPIGRKSVENAIP